MLLDDTLRTLVSGRLRGFERQALSILPDSSRAAVALALIEEGDGAPLPGMRAPSGVEPRSRADPDAARV